MKKHITYCNQCDNCKVYPDPDFDDWFCHDDIKIVCNVNNMTMASAYSYGGVAFAVAKNVASDTYDYVGIRLVFRNRELALYAGKQFIDLYVKHLFDADIVKD